MHMHVHMYMDEYRICRKLIAPSVRGRLGGSERGWEEGGREVGRKERGCEEGGRLGGRREV